MPMTASRVAATSAAGYRPGPPARPRRAVARRAASSAASRAAPARSASPAATVSTASIASARVRSQAASPASSRRYATRIARAAASGTVRGGASTSSSAASSTVRASLGAERRHRHLLQHRDLGRMPHQEPGEAPRCAEQPRHALGRGVVPEDLRRLARRPLLQACSRRRAPHRGRPRRENAASSRSSSTPVAAASVRARRRRVELGESRSGESARVGACRDIRAGQRISRLRCSSKGVTWER